MATEGVEQRVDRLDAVVFGFYDKEDNSFVPGLLQTSADWGKRFERMENWGLKLLSATTFGILALVAHTYGFLDVLIKLFSVGVK